MKITCLNCGKETTTPHSFTTKSCSPECSLQRDMRALEHGGYHVLVRDEAIDALKIENQALREELDQMRLTAGLYAT